MKNLMNDCIKEKGLGLLNEFIIDDIPSHYENSIYTSREVLEILQKEIEREYNIREPEKAIKDMEKGLLLLIFYGICRTKAVRKSIQNQEDRDYYNSLREKIFIDSKSVKEYRGLRDRAIRNIKIYEEDAKFFNSLCKVYMDITYG